MNEYMQEKIEMDEQELHKEDLCEGAPYCAYCVDDWEEANREELDRQGYYDSKGEWTR